MNYVRPMENMLADVKIVIKGAIAALLGTAGVVIEGTQWLGLLAAFIGLIVAIFGIITARQRYQNNKLENRKFKLEIDQLRKNLQELNEKG